MLTSEATDEDDEVSAEDMLAASVASRRASPNLSYYAFTATPKSKTLELFGRLPNPEEPPSKTNKPQAFHVYSMRQAIEEGYILDVLKNYTSYKVAYNLAQKVASADTEVDSKKAKVKLNQWVRLHDYNIAQKVKVIVEHFRDTVMGLLNGHAKAMVVTGSRKEAVRYKLEFDKYIQKKGYSQLSAMVAFSGEVDFSADDPHCEGLLGEKFTETSMNPGLKGRDMRKAFDTDEYHVMIVAKKFQTGFDQPKLCAMYVDKKLGGVECVQTLSRLNRIYPGKEETYVLDFFNEPDGRAGGVPGVLPDGAAARCLGPEPDLGPVRKAAGGGHLPVDGGHAVQRGLLHQEQEQRRHQQHLQARGGALAEALRAGAGRLQQAQEAVRARQVAGRRDLHRQCRNGHEGSQARAGRARASSRADLVAFTRYYEFMSQIVDYDSHDLEKLSLYARHLAPLLREKIARRGPDRSELSRAEPLPPVEDQAAGSADGQGRRRRALRRQRPRHRQAAETRKRSGSRRSSPV